MAFPFIMSLKKLFGFNAQPDPEPTPIEEPRSEDKISLKLAFSGSADRQRIGKLFAPATKSKIDPHNFVVKREKDVFEHAIDRSHVAFLFNLHSGAVKTLSFAYDVRKDQRSTHLHTEIGTSLASLGGYKTAQIVISALTLNEWWNTPPQKKIVTEILPENVPSLNAYKKLGWVEIDAPDLTHELHVLCNESIAPEDKGRQTVWFEANQKTLQKMAQVLLEYMDKGYVENKHTGDRIPVDLSAMFATGLTKEHLKAIARGHTNRRLLEMTYDPPEPK